MVAGEICSSKSQISRFFCENNLETSRYRSTFPADPTAQRMILCDRRSGHRVGSRLLSAPASSTSENTMFNPQQLKKKTNHDIAYLVILLLFVAGIFLFAMNFVNTHLPLP